MFFRSARVFLRFARVSGLRTRVFSLAARVFFDATGRYHGPLPWSSAESGPLPRNYPSPGIAHLKASIFFRRVRVPLHICMEIPCTGRVPPDICGWRYSGGERYQRLRPTSGCLFRRRNLRKELLALVNGHRERHPDWAARALRFTVPRMLGREPLPFHCRCWKLAHWRTGHLLFWIPGAAHRHPGGFQVYYRLPNRPADARGWRPWHLLPPNQVHCWAVQDILICIVDWRPPSRIIPLRQETGTRVTHTFNGAGLQAEGGMAG